MRDPNSSNADEMLRVASTAPEILSAITKGLAKPECTDATIDELIDLIPRFSTDTFRKYQFGLSSDVSNSDEPDTWDEKAYHRLQWLIAQHANDFPLHWERLDEPPDLNSPDGITISTFSNTPFMTTSANFAPPDTQHPASPALADSWLTFKRMHINALFVETDGKRYEPNDAENAAIKTLTAAGYDNHGFKILNPDTIAPRRHASSALMSILTALRNGIPELGEQAPGFVTAFERVHNLWKQVDHDHPGKYKHPLAPIVERCLQDWNPTTKPETRPTQILPKALPDANPTETQEELPLGLFAEQGVEQQLIIPGIIRDDSSIVPAFPLDVYEVSEGKPPERGGKGAPLAQRIWINALLALPYAKREHDSSWRLATTLRDIKEWAYPQSWNRTVFLPRIQAALKDVHNMRVYWERRLWNIVQVFAIPASNIKLDDPLPLLVRLPDGMPGEGAMINVAILRLLGVESAPQFRAWIKLAYIWDDAKQKNGGHRIYAQRPQVLRNNRDQPIDAKGNILPSGNWNHKRAVRTGEPEDNPAAARVPILDDDGLIHLFFDNKPVPPKTRETRLSTARKELADMVNQKYVVIQELPDGVRILEPRLPEFQTLS